MPRNASSCVLCKRACSFADILRSPFCPSCLQGDLVSSGLPPVQAQFVVSTVQRALRDSTVTTYSNLVEKHDRWPLVTDADTVRFLITTHCASPESCRVALAAATKLHDNAGHPPVPHGPLVTNYIRGLRHTPRPVARHALDIRRTLSPRLPETFPAARVVRHMLRQRRTHPLVFSRGVILMVLLLGSRRFSDLRATRTSHVNFTTTHSEIRLAGPLKNKSENSVSDAKSVVLIPNVVVGSLRVNPSTILREHCRILRLQCTSPDPLLTASPRCPHGITSSTFGAAVRSACRDLNVPSAGIGAHIGKYPLASAAAHEDWGLLSMQAGISPTTLATHYAKRSAPKDSATVDMVLRIANTLL